MSQLNEDPGPLPAELRAFVDRHRATGEPTGAELGRALLKVHTATRPGTFGASSLRRWVPPEVLAVAALVVLTIGGAGVGYWVRERRAAEASQALERARAAWAQGDLDAAEAAFGGCDTDDCRRLAAALKKARGDQTHLETLDEAGAGALLALDAELSTGAPSAVAVALEQPELAAKNLEVFLLAQRRALARRGLDARVIDEAMAAFERARQLAETSPAEAAPALRTVTRLVPGSGLARAAELELARLERKAPPERPMDERVLVSGDPAALLAEGTRALERRRYDDAITALSSCVSIAPGDAECTFALASVLAARSAASNDTRDVERAQALYERFLTIAPWSDPRRGRVEELLRTPGATSTVANLNELYLRAYQLKDSDPEGARALFEQVVAASQPSSVLHQKALSRLGALKERAAPVAEREGITPLLLNPGETRDLVFFGVERVAVGDSTVVDVSVVEAGDRLRARALSGGQTTLLAWTSSGARQAWLVSVAATPMGRLRIASNPTNAKIFVDGKDTGRRTPVLPRDPLLVPPGRHRLRFELEGHGSDEQVIEVVEGDNRVIKADLR